MRPPRSDAAPATWEPMDLPLTPSYPPMEAELARDIPEGGDWQYEPKWDGFRCIAYKDGDHVELQSKAGQPLGRYFPEMVSAVRKLGNKLLYFLQLSSQICILTLAATLKLKAFSSRKT